MADYINKIRTTEGDKPVNYEALANKPNSLPNPNKIKFTGSVVAEYDGSSEVTVNIPNGASEEQAAQIQTNTNDISELKNKTSELKSDLSKLENKISDGFSLMSISYVTGGLSTATGADASVSSKERTDFIEIKGATIIENDSTPSHIFYYDENKSFVTYKSIQPNQYYVVDSGYNFFRIMKDLSKNVTVLEINITANEVIKNLLVNENKGLTNEFSSGYIKASAKYGTVVNMTIVDNTKVNHLVIPCKIGDVFTITGTGGADARLHMFVDDDYKMVDCAVANAVYSNKKITSPTTGYLIVNCFKSYQYSVVKNGFFNISDIETTLTSIKNDITSASNRVDREIKHQISDTFVKPADKNFMYSYPFKIVAGRTYILYNTTSNPARNSTAINAFTRVSQTTANVETIAKGLYSRNSTSKGYKVFKATTNAEYLYIVANGNGSFAFVDTETINEEIKKVESKTQAEPLVRFEFDHNLRDVSSDNARMDWTNKHRQTDVLDQVYDLYDGLVSDYPNLVSRVDIADELSLTYPSYANGVGSTPSYRTYMYKFSYQNTNVIDGITYNRKRKLLLVSGTHGNEIASPFNSYLLMKHFCEDYLTDANMFKLRSTFDIYVIPCLNGYGMYNITRGNGNKVNINRNYPIIGWESRDVDTKDSPTANEYTGETAGSEFETQIVMGVVENWKPDILIDHHNYSVLDFAFYTDICNEKFLPLAYQSCVDCSFAFKKNLPSYFGNNFDILVHRIGAAPGTLELPFYGTTNNWASQNGVPMAVTVEISECINYVNGVYDGVNRNDNFGNDTFSVGEYTLRNQVLRYCQWILDNVD